MRKNGETFSAIIRYSKLLDKHISESPVFLTVEYSHN